MVKASLVAAGGASFFQWSIQLLQTEGNPPLQYSGG